ncbi:hypothetical protein PCASD_15590 [Puccinia coronata f. sp. avenae]|uniref:Uncharacterized protein n=1 Tax=Puccinia coronata f. sp. avenae TaxID=200324 RepID=A0A2N5TW94_9BASI|nr:hypothetical protein PCASD_15590 [Puccinia coronata f. sp. avenae]
MGKPPEEQLIARADHQLPLASFLYKIDGSTSNSQASSRRELRWHMQDNQQPRVSKWLPPGGSRVGMLKPAPGYPDAENLPDVENRFIRRPLFG